MWAICISLLDLPHPHRQLGDVSNSTTIKAFYQQVRSGRVLADGYPPYVFENLGKNATLMTEILTPSQYSHSILTGFDSFIGLEHAAIA